MSNEKESLSYNLSKIKRLLLLAKNACKQLPEIENFPLEPQKNLTINDITDKKVVKLDKLLPLVKDGKFDCNSFMQMIKDVPYTIKPQERHLKTRDGKVYDDKFQLIEAAFENGIKLTHQYQFGDDEFYQDNYNEAKKEIQKALSGKSSDLGDVIITNADGEEIQCDFKQGSNIVQIKDAQKNAARFNPFNENLEVLDYNDTALYFSPRKEGKGCFVSIVDNIKTGVRECYREDGSLHLYDNDRLREHFTVEDDGTRIFSKDDDVISYRANDTLRSTWNEMNGIGTMYKEDGKTIDYTWDKTNKKTYYNISDSKDKEKSPSRDTKKPIGIVITGRNIPWDWRDSKHFR